MCNPYPVYYQAWWKNVLMDWKCTSSTTEVSPQTLTFSLSFVFCPSTSLHLCRMAPWAGEASGDSVRQQHGGRALGAQLLHRRPLLHPQQPHQCGLRQRLRQHRRRKDLFHLHHADWGWVCLVTAHRGGTPRGPWHGKWGHARGTDAVRGKMTCRLTAWNQTSWWLLFFFTVCCNY